MFWKKIPKFEFELGNSDFYIKKNSIFLLKQYRKGNKSFVLHRILKVSNWKEIFESENFRNEPENTLIEHFRRRYVLEEKEILIKYKIFINRWKQIHNCYNKSLLNFFNLKKAKMSVIKSYFSIIPISPRSISNWSTPVSIDLKIENQIMILSHEIFHFYYFQKLEEIMPEYKKEISNKNSIIAFDSPYLVWHLSEILDFVIMGTETSLHTCFNNKEIEFATKWLKGYPIHKSIIINGKNLIEYFEDLYFKYKHFGMEIFVKIALIKIYQIKNKFPKDSYKISNITENYILEFKNNNFFKKFF